MTEHCFYCAALREKYPEAKLRECKHGVKELDSHDILHQPKEKKGACVFVHPRCYQGPPSGALISCLQERGYDINAISIGPVGVRGYCELVRVRGTDPDGLLHLERMSGEQFDHRPGVVPTGGTAA